MISLKSWDLHGSKAGTVTVLEIHRDNFFSPVEQSQPQTTVLYAAVPETGASMETAQADHLLQMSALPGKDCPDFSVPAVKFNKQMEK